MAGHAFASGFICLSACKNEEETREESIAMLSPAYSRAAAGGRLRACKAPDPDRSRHLLQSRRA